VLLFFFVIATDTSLQEHCDRVTALAVYIPDLGLIPNASYPD
jgi:hypothetical protein